MNWIDFFRTILIVHGMAFAALFVFVFFAYYKDIFRGHAPESALRFRIYILMSYVIAILYMTYSLIERLNRPDIALTLPAACISLLLGDLGLYQIFKIRHENKE